MSITAAEKTYVLAYSHDIRCAVLENRCQHWVSRRVTGPVSRPITDGFEILEPEQAGHDLFMAIMRYYRAFGDTPDSHAAPIIIGLQRGIHDPKRCVAALNDALCFFVGHEAARDDAGVRNAVQAAQLALKTLQGTWAEMPAASVQTTYWLIQ